MVRQAAIAASSRFADPRALLERDEELGALQRAIEGASGGRGSLMVVEAAAGIGKSALLSAAADLGAVAHMRVLRARAAELEAGFAFGVVRQLLEPAIYELDARARARLLDGPAALARAALDETGDIAPAGAEAGFAAMHGLYWLCANLCEQDALLLSVDDLHWADPPSLRFLTFLAPRVEEHRMLLIVATRPEQRGIAETLGCLQALRHTSTQRPRPLGEIAVARIVARELGDAEPAFVRACHDAVAGNPFLLHELIAELRREGVRPTAAAAQRVTEIGPRAVSRTMLARIASLPAAAASIARATAILGDGAAPRHVRALAGVDAERAAEAADALARASILRRGDRLEFVHPIVRRAIEQDMAPRERSRAQADAARLLAAAGLPAERVALHLLAAEPDGAPLVVETLRAAAKAALARGAPDVAARYLRRAHAEPPPAPVRSDVLHELGSAELLTGNLRGIEHLRSALDLADESSRHAELALELARFMVAAGTARQAVRVLEEALRRLGDRDRELRLRLLAALTGIAMTDLDLSASAHRRLAGFDEPPGHTPGERKMLVQLAMIESFAGRPAQRCVDLARRALAGGTLVDEAAVDTQMLVIACSVLMLSGEPEEAHAAFSAAIERCRAAGAVMAFAIHSCFRGCAAIALGRLDDAEADLRTALPFTATPMLITTIHGYAVSFLADTLLERGDLDAAEELLQTRADSVTDSNAHDTTYVLLSRGRLRLARHQPGAALEDLDECARRLRQWRIINPAWSDWRSHAVLAHLALGDRDGALRVSGEELELARAFAAPRALGVALRSRALAEGGQTGIELLHDAANTLEGTPAVLERARTLIDLGAAVRRANRRSEAREPLRRGLDLARHCGARALVQRAREELTAAGARPRREPLTGIDALTATELRVVRLAAQKMTNREIAQSLFVTTKTIETHLAHAYAKLKIRSRTDLGEALADPPARS